MQKKKTEELVKRAKRRDEDAFTELMQLYMKDLYRVAVAILMNDEDAADAIQDTILACWEKLGTLKKDQYFKSWMTRILINKCYDIRRRTLPVVDWETCVEPAAQDRCNLELKEALASLDEKYRCVMILFYSEGYHVDEIAAFLKITPSAVKTRLQRGREKLARYYNECGKG